MEIVPVELIRPREPKPAWLKVRAPGSENYLRLKSVMKELKLHTVCEEARCPNIGECWHHGTATFMILGDVCTRACAYCAVAHGKPHELDLAQPARVADALYRMARSGGKYPRSLELLDRSRQYRPSIATKTGIMVGLGEEIDEVVSVFGDLRRAGVSILTIGQYLRPSPAHAPMARYYHPDEFADLKSEALSRGFVHVESGPLVRSSYHAHEQADAFELHRAR